MGVRQYNFYGVLVEEYTTVKDALSALGASGKSAKRIERCCVERFRPDGMAWTFRGFIWRTIGDDELIDLPNAERVRVSKAPLIRQYTRRGMLVGEYQTMSIASEHTGVGYDNIEKCLKNVDGHLTAGGWRWSYLPPEELAPYPNLIRKYTLDGEFVLDYEDSEEAATLTGFSMSGICQACRRKVKYKGYQWRRACDDELYQK